MNQRELLEQKRQAAYDRYLLARVEMKRAEREYKAYEKRIAKLTPTNRN